MIRSLSVSLLILTLSLVGAGTANAQRVSCWNDAFGTVCNETARVSGYVAPVYAPTYYVPTYYVPTYYAPTYVAPTYVAPTFYETVYRTYGGWYTVATCSYC